VNTYVKKWYDCQAINADFGLTKGQDPNNVDLAAAVSISDILRKLEQIKDSNPAGGPISEKKLNLNLQLVAIANHVKTKMRKSEIKLKLKHPFRAFNFRAFVIKDFNP